MPLKIGVHSSHHFSDQWIIAEKPIPIIIIFHDCNLQYRAPISSPLLINPSNGLYGSKYVVRAVAPNKNISSLLQTGQANARKLPMPPVVATVSHFLIIFFL